MIYYALRSTEDYLDRLNRVSTGADNFQIVSVVGGLAFLHALGKHTRKIWLLDTDPEVIGYCNMILSLIRNVPTLREFVEFLSGHYVRMESGNLDFQKPFGRETRLGTYLPMPGEQALFMNIYGRMQFDAGAARGTIGESTILFRDFSLTPNTFCWLFGRGAFANEESFATLRTALIRSQISVRCAPLETFEFELLDPGRPAYFLASNCESPLFTKSDVIFRHAAGQKLRTINYVSWFRECQLPLTADGDPGLSPVTSLAGKRVYSLWYTPTAAEHAQFASFSEVESVAALAAARIYGGDLLLLDLSNRSAESLFGLLSAIRPKFLTVLFAGLSLENERMRIIEESDFPLSYRVSRVDMPSSKFQLQAVLRGLKKPGIATKQTS